MADPIEGRGDRGPAIVACLGRGERREHHPVEGLPASGGVGEPGIRGAQATAAAVLPV